MDKDMKIALLLSGRFRDSNDCCNLLKDNFIKNYNVDVFIDYRYETENDIEVSKEHIKNLYNPKKINFEKYPNTLQEEIKKINSYSKFGEVNPKNFLLMCYGMYSVNNLKKEYENENKFKYDIVVRTRFDIKLKSPFSIILRNNIINIPIGWDHRGGFNDLFAYGDSQSMDYYCSLYQNIFHYLNEGRLVHPEKLLKHHLTISNINIMRNYINLFLRDMDISKLEYSCQ